MNVGVWCIWTGDSMLGCMGMSCWWWWWGIFRYSGFGSGVASLVGWEAALGELEKKWGVAFVKRWQFLIPNRRLWWTGSDTPEWSSSIMGRGNRRERERQSERERGREDVKFQKELPYGGEQENRFQIKGKDVGVRGQQVLWEGITGLRLLHVSLLGLWGSLAWKWVPLSGTVPDTESSWDVYSRLLSWAESRHKVVVTWQRLSEYKRDIMNEGSSRATQTQWIYMWISSGFTFIFSFCVFLLDMEALVSKTEADWQNINPSA